MPQAQKTGVHGGNTALDKRLKEEAEQIFEKKYSRELFHEEFGRYYAEEKNEEAEGQQENGFIWIEEETWKKGTKEGAY